MSIPFILNLEIVVQADSIWQAIGAIFTGMAALATAWAAYSARTSAKAAQASANQWKEQVAFNLFYQKAASAASKYPYIRDSINQVCNLSMTGVSSGRLAEVLQGRTDLDKYEQQYSSRLKRVSSGNAKQIAKYIHLVFDEIIETYYLSRDYLELSKGEIDNIHQIVGDCFQQVKVIVYVLDNIERDDINEVDVDALFKTSDSTQHFYKDFLSRSDLIEAYLKYVLSDKEEQSWALAKQEYIKVQQRYFESISTGADEATKRHYEEYCHKMFD